MRPGSELIAVRAGISSHFPRTRCDFLEALAISPLSPTFQIPSIRRAQYTDAPDESQRWSATAARRIEPRKFLERLMSAGSKAKDLFFFILRFAVAAGIITWLVAGKAGKLSEALRSFDIVWLIPAVALYAGHLCVAALRWKMLLDVQEAEISYFDTLSLTMQGFFFSLVIPGSLGGDVVKAAFVAKRVPEGRKLSGVFTILVDRLLGVIALFALAGCAGLASMEFLGSLSGFTALATRVLVAGCVVGVGAAIFFAFHRTLEKFWGVSALIAFADKLTRGAPSRMMEAMDAFRDSWPVLLKAVGMSVVFIHLQLSAVIYCIARGFGVTDIPKGIYILATTLGNAVGALPLTPSGTGTRDVVIEKILSAAGAADGAALGVPLLFSAIIIGFNMSGGVFLVMGAKKRRQRENNARPAEPSGKPSTD